MKQNNTDQGGKKKKKKSWQGLSESHVLSQRRTFQEHKGQKAEMK